MIVLIATEQPDKMKGEEAADISQDAQEEEEKEEEEKR